MDKVRTKKVKPACFGDEYDGFILVQRLTHDELNAAREAVGLFDMDQTEEKTTKQNIEFMRKAYAEAKKFIVAAEVVRKSDGANLDLDELDYETELSTYQSDMSQMFLSGWAMGKKNGQQQG